MRQYIKETYIYKRALAATEVKPYNVLKLDHVVDTVAQALGHVHSHGFFKEYTRHGPEHSAEIIKSLDWIIEPNQRNDLSNADYLFLLISCLIHDLGMLATQQEFQNRSKSTIQDFEAQLKTTVHGREFIASIPKGYIYRDELVFEEYVRHNHAARIRSALLRDGDGSVGDVQKIASVLDTALNGLDAKCRHDLALICESHHKDDLADISKYQTKSVHGPSPQAEINIQAVAILLRAADVLQIGTGRTPSIDFSIISPTNPISHLHWMKEMGVKRVEGEIIAAQSAEERDARVVKIYGRFDDAEPFFALQNHLKYVGNELKRCVKWSREDSQSADRPYTIQ